MAGITVEVEMAFMLNKSIMHPAGFEVEAIERAALLQAARCTLADLQTTLLIKPWNLNPRSDRHQLLRHLAERTSWHATINVGAVRLNHTELSLWTRIPFARRRDVFIRMNHSFVIL